MSWPFYACIICEGGAYRNRGDGWLVVLVVTAARQLLRPFYHPLLLWSQSQHLMVMTHLLFPQQLIAMMPLMPALFVEVAVTAIIVVTAGGAGWCWWWRSDGFSSSSIFLDTSDSEAEADTEDELPIVPTRGY